MIGSVSNNPELISRQALLSFENRAGLQGR
jgi:hypothetical protein